MRVRGLKSARRLLWGIRGRVLGGDLILGYHRVDVATHDPWSLCVHPEAFRKQMEILRRDCSPVPLAELTGASSACSSGAQRPRIAVTFDDGYADVLDQGLPVLEEFEIPATVFVVEEGMRGSFWWDRLAGILYDEGALPSRLHMQVGETSLGWSEESEFADRHSHLYSALRQAETGERDAALDELEGRARAANAMVPAPAPTLQRERIAWADGHPLLEVGSHGATHLQLRDLDGPRLDREIEGSARALGALLGRSVESFSYPHGILDERSRRRVIETGYRRACASRSGLVNSDSDSYRLPRLWPTTTTPDRFRAWLRSWTGR